MRSLGRKWFNALLATLSLSLSSFSRSLPAYFVKLSFLLPVCQLLLGQVADDFDLACSAAKYAATFFSFYFMPPPLLFTASEAISLPRPHPYPVSLSLSLALSLSPSLSLRKKVHRIYVKLFMTDGDDFPLFATFINWISQAFFLPISFSFFYFMQQRLIEQFS